MKPLKPLSRLIAYAQMILTLVWFIGIFTIVILYETGLSSRFSADQLKAFEDWAKFFRDASFLVMTFWFQRLRGEGGDSNTVTQTQHPDGTVTLSSPAHLPLPSLPTPPVAPAPLESKP